jgi:hypothetical protein
MRLELRKLLKGEKEMSDKKEVVITFTAWTSHCADGCCTDYGTELTVNGIKAESPYIGDNVAQSIEFVLQQLGYAPIINKE